MAGFFKKIVGKGLGLLGKAVGSTGLPGASAAAKLVSKVQSKVDPKKSTASASKSAPSKSSAIANTPTVATRSMSKSDATVYSTGYGGWFGLQYTKLKDWFRKQKSENPVMYWIGLIVLILVSSVVLWMLWKVIKWLYRKVTGRNSRHGATRRMFRPRSTQARATAPSAPRNGKRRASAAQLAALARGRAALKRKRKR